MTEIIKMTVEEFDDEGNLTKRTITEYRDGTYQTRDAPRDLPWSPGIQVGDVWPYAGQVTSYPKGQEPYTINDYNVGTFHRCTVGGTDRDREGQYVGPYGVGVAFGE